MNRIPESANAGHAAFRKQLYDQVPDFWADLHGGEYALYDLIRITPDLVEEIRAATGKISRLLTLFTNRMQKLPDDQWKQLIQQLGYPQQTAEWLRINNLPWPSMIARADWALTPDGPKLLEWNADTPSFIKELFDVNGMVCRHFQHDDPNEGMDRKLQHALRDAVIHAARWIERPESALNIAVSGYPDDEEDTATNRYLTALLRQAGFEVSDVPLRELSIDENGLYAPDGKQIEIWFRPGYPLEFLAEEKDPVSGLPLGDAVAALVRARRLAMINPFTALLHQNKMLQALIWAAQDEPWLSDEVKETIRTYFLPGYDTPAPFEDEQHTYVMKPAFGREGGGVRIIRPGGTEIYPADLAEQEHQSPMLYQQFAEMPNRRVMTVSGPENTYLLMGCFCIAGQGSALGFRAGGPITDNRSYYLPTALAKEGNDLNNDIF